MPADVAWLWLLIKGYSRPAGRRPPGRFRRGCAGLIGRQPVPDRAPARGVAAERLEGVPWMHAEGRKKEGYPSFCIPSILPLSCKFLYRNGPSAGTASGPGARHEKGRGGLAAALSCDNRQIRFHGFNR